MRQPFALAVLVASTACGGPPPAMIEHAHAVAGYGVELFAEGNTLAIHVHQPSGMNMVLWDPILEDGRVAITAGVVSGGGDYDRVYCFDVGGLSPAPAWAEHVRWREPGGGAVTPRATRGAAAHDAVGRCPR
jgi:hypothetical protein